MLRVSRQWRRSFFLGTAFQELKLGDALVTVCKADAHITVEELCERAPASSRDRLVARAHSSSSANEGMLPLLAARCGSCENSVGYDAEGGLH